MTTDEELHTELESYAKILKSDDYDHEAQLLRAAADRLRELSAEVERLKKEYANLERKHEILVSNVEDVQSGDWNR